MVLIGTAASVAAIWGQSGGAIGGRPVSCVLLDGSAAAGAALLPPVIGDLEALVDFHTRVGVSLALIALPSDGRAGGPSALPRLRAGLGALGIPHRVVPTLADLMYEDAPAETTVAASPTGLPARLDYAALIGRTHHDLDREAVASIITGKRVLITGAGGSIGSELARVVAGFAPEQVILMERAENALFTIDGEMKRRFPGVSRRAVLHDVVDAERTLRHLVECRPHVVFHAAAHKHVPLMEDHPSHAIDNNVFGTKAIADAAVAVGAERFVMISSDKAVNPTSVMGATKRLAELYVGGLARLPGPRTSKGSGGGTHLSMVRFGNVLGSACSVIPIWQQQLAEGGPLTVTDPRMTRYFMTIPEAATLVVQAAAMTGVDNVEGGAGEGGVAPVYVLDMGEPVRILDLAVRLAAFHGFSPALPEGASSDLAATVATPANAPTISIVFSGIRPGEKLAEQLAYAAENLAPTKHPGITCWRGGPGEVADLSRMVAELASVRRGGEREDVLAVIRKHVPEMSRG